MFEKKNFSLNNLYFCENEIGVISGTRQHKKKVQKTPT